ncbi:MAG TPA: ExbD/TolR family protein [Rhodoblastus sp.]|nr:ExbD/TolR family protein [Rhodoblastus sp.]
MGMAVPAGGKGGRRRRGVPRYRAMADINMTPFIDVMLVLLIIFMVAAPLLSTGVPIDLPATKAGELNIDKKPIAVAIDDRGDIFLMDQKVADADLVAAVQAQAKEGVDERVYVRAAKLVPYGRVAQVMSDLTAAGFKKVALVTSQESDKQSDNLSDKPGK